MGLSASAERGSYNILVFTVGVRKMFALACVICEFLHEVDSRVPMRELPGLVSLFDQVVSLSNLIHRVSRFPDKGLGENILIRGKHYCCITLSRSCSQVVSDNWTFCIRARFVLRVRCPCCHENGLHHASPAFWICVLAFMSLWHQLGVLL